jgi:hypothetical protein
MRFVCVSKKSLKAFAASAGSFEVSTSINKWGMSGNRVNSSRTSLDASQRTTPGASRMVVGYLESGKRTMSEELLPRAKAGCLPSGDQAKHQIWPLCNELSR